jgi:sodium-dependent dicarboxylate transporter 2/3/5
MSPLGLGFAAVTIIYAFGFLDTKDLKSVDWDVLLMIAGGLLLSYLMEKGNWPQFLSNALNSSGINGHAQLLILILVAAFGSAVSSNTATAVVLMPIAMKLLPQPSSAIAIAASCALGVCFSISTPANALLSGSHGLRNKDFLKLGLPIMLFGCLLIFFTAELVVNWWIKMA